MCCAVFQQGITEQAPGKHLSTQRSSSDGNKTFPQSSAQCLNHSRGSLWAGSLSAEPRPVLGNVQMWHTHLSVWQSQHSCYQHCLCHSRTHSMARAPHGITAMEKVPNTSTSLRLLAFLLAGGFILTAASQALLALCCSLLNSVPLQDTDLTHPLPHPSTSDTPSTLRRQTNPFLTAVGHVCPGKAKPTSKFGNMVRARAKDHPPHKVMQLFLLLGEVLA